MDTGWLVGFGSHLLHGALSAFDWAWYILKPYVDFLASIPAPVWITLSWTFSAMLGMAVSGRSFFSAYPDWRAVRRGMAPEPVIITAWLHVRSHAMYFAVHFLFFLVGINSFLQLHPFGLPPFPLVTSPLDMALSIILLVGATYILVVLSLLASRDRLKAIRIARRDKKSRTGG